MEAIPWWVLPNVPCPCVPELMDRHGNWASVHRKCPQSAFPHPLVVQTDLKIQLSPLLQTSVVCKGGDVVFMSSGGARRQNMPNTMRCSGSQS